MTDIKPDASSEPTVEEQARSVLTNALDEISRMVPGGSVRWSITTLPTMLLPVLTDLDQHLRKPMPPMPQLELPEPTAEAVRRHEVRRREEQRYRSTAAELAEAFREGL